MGNQIASEIPGPKAKAIFQTMFMSDLHLESGNTIPPEFAVVARSLILAGDIGRPDVPSLQTFLLAQCQRFERIFYVAEITVSTKENMKTAFNSFENSAISILVFTSYKTKAIFFPIVCVYSVLHSGLMFLDKQLRKSVDISMIIVSLRPWLRLK